MFCKCQNKSSRSQFLRSCKNAPVFRTLGPHLPSAQLATLLNHYSPSPEYAVPPLQSNNNNPGAIRNSQYKQVLRRQSSECLLQHPGEADLCQESVATIIVLYTCIAKRHCRADSWTSDGREMTTVMGTIATSSLVYHLAAGTQCHRSITAALLTSILFLNNVMLLT